MADNVQVVLRIRPLIEQEIHRGCQSCLQAILEENQVQIIGTDKAFTYNHVFDQTSTQSEFYNKSVKSLIQNLFKGFNVTILAYGQTGSGKTHSMGTCYNGMGDKGIIPSAIDDIFEFIEKNSNTYNFQVSVSFMELYKEVLYDLLSNKPRDQCIIDIREDLKGIKMQGLSEVTVTNASSTIKCLMDGSAGRSTGATAMNAHSSRSHAIFTINIYMEHKVDKSSATTAKFHLVDLAGSERSKKTKATGERLKEGININKGLLALGNVISALGDEAQKGYISYRDSKLTRLLQDSLGGNSMTMMIACVSPADYNLEETTSTLRYADRARKIKNKPIVNQDPQKAEIIKLQQIIHTLRMQVTGSHSSSEETLQKDELIQELQTKNRELNSALSIAITENTAMFERQLLIQNANEKLKRKLLELKESYNVTLSNISMTIGTQDCPINIKEEIEKLHDMQNLISDLQTEQKKHEEEILTHEYQNQNSPTSDNVHVEKDLDEAQEKHTCQQLNMNRQLHELNRALAMKEKLANQMISNNHMNGDVIDLSQFNENENKIKNLEKEKIELLQQLKQVHSTEQSSKLAEQRRKRVKELEVQITELKKKLLEQARLIKMKEKDEIRIKQLNQEIQSMKSNKVKLIRSMRSEEQKFREWKMKREKEIMKLKDQDRKLHNQIVKMENMHKKQQTVLKRKFEEAAAVNKRLKDALALQKIVQDRRAQNNGKLEKIHQFVSQEVEIISSTIEAKKTLENLIEERATLTQQLEQYKTTPNSDCSNHIEQLNSEIELITAHITDLQQKILDSDQESKAKTRWDTVQTMIDAKCALKHLFDLVIEIRSKAIDTEFELKDLKGNYREKENSYQELEKQMKLIENKYSEELAHINKENEEKIAVFLKHLSTKEHITNDEQLKERLALQSKELERFSNLQEQNIQLQEELEHMKHKLEQVNEVAIKASVAQKPKKKKKTVDTTYVAHHDSEEEADVSFEDDTKDPDWHLTPLMKRTRSVRQRDTKIGNKENEISRLTMKRSSDGTAKCTCKSSNCRTSVCGCKKLGLNCNKSCKCTNCGNNKDMERSLSKNDDTDSDNSFKKPRLFGEPDENLLPTPLKYKKSYFD